MNKMLNLKGKKYVLVEWPDNQVIIDYLEKKTNMRYTKNVML